jgi:PadR family transcriptional regulator PadR
MSRQTLKVLGLMLDHPEVEWYGWSLFKATGIAPGTLYPILHRLLHENWLEVRAEPIDPSEAKRPARRLYRLSGKGELAARARLDRAPRGVTPHRLRPHGGTA